MLLTYKKRIKKKKNFECYFKIPTLSKLAYCSAKASLIALLAITKCMDLPYV